MYYVYVLHCSDGLLYTGYTNNLKVRFGKHQNGFVRSTQNRLPLKLIHYESFLNKLDAKQREQYLKGGNGKKELKIMLGNYFDHTPWKT